MAQAINLKALQHELCNTLCRSVELEPHKESEIAVHLPFTGRDGDHVVLYMSMESMGWRITDKGVTLMRLSYENDLDRLFSGARKNLFETILQEAGLYEDNGELGVITPADRLVSGLFTLAQGITRVEDMGLWTKSRVESTFYDDLKKIVSQTVPSDRLHESYCIPNIPESENYPVDYYIETEGKPLYLFGVLNKDKAMLATIILQHLSTYGHKFDSMVVCSDFDTLPKIDVRRLMAVANDIVPSIDEEKTIVKKIKNRLAA